MKHFILSISVFLLLTGSAQAQQFYAGVKAGVSATQISGDQLSGFNKAGIVGGGFVGLELSELFNLGVEILYYQKGSRKNADPEKEDSKSYLLRLNYFEIPVVLQWKFSKRFSFEAGPTFAALVGSIEEDEFGALSQPREFSNTEIGFMGGIKVNLVNQFAFIARYENSLLPVREHLSGQGYRLNRGQYNTALMFAFQYTFRKHIDE
jgi:hypothetical protein